MSLMGRVYEVHHCNTPIKKFEMYIYYMIIYHITFLRFCESVLKKSGHHKRQYATLRIRFGIRVGLNKAGVSIRNLYSIFCEIS